MKYEHEDRTMSLWDPFANSNLYEQCHVNTSEHIHHSHQVQIKKRKETLNIVHIHLREDFT